MMHDLCDSSTDWLGECFEKRQTAADCCFLLAWRHLLLNKHMIVDFIITKLCLNVLDFWCSCKVSIVVRRYVPYFIQSGIACRINNSKYAVSNHQFLATAVGPLSKALYPHAQIVQRNCVLLWIKLQGTCLLTTYYTLNTSYCF